MESEKRTLLKKRKAPLWVKLACLALVALVLVAVEGVSRLLSEETQLDRILCVLKQDPVLFWRQRPNLKTRFEGTKVHTNALGLRVSESSPSQPPVKQPERTRILCLGASPTFGWGVRFEETYSNRLEQMLTTDKYKVEVFNCGEIGFSSYQGKLFFERELLELTPDLITVSYVINDVDKYRFFRTTGTPDKTLQPKSVFITEIRNFLDKSKFFHIYEKTIKYLMGQRTSFKGKPVEVYRPRMVRVPIDDYRENLSEIIRIARNNNIEILLLKFPVNLPPAGELPPDVIKASKLSIGEGLKSMSEEDYEKAVKAFTRATKHNPYSSEAHYFLGLCQRRLGEKKAAAKAFEDAYKSESYRCGRDGLRYNEVMEAVATKMKIDLVDLASAFKKHDDEYLFISPDDDPIHPNAKGHEIIAKEVYSHLKREPSVLN